MITGIISGEQAGRLLWVAYHSIEVYHCIEVAGGTNPVVDRLAIGLAEWRSEERRVGKECVP